VGKSIHVGEAKLTLHEMRGAFTPLRDGREQIGWLLRSKPGCLPLVVSPGHKVAMASAPELVMRFVTTYRLPEPTRLADHIASRRDRNRP
jgi:deoxyribonuclease V